MGVSWGNPALAAAGGSEYRVGKLRLIPWTFLCRSVLGIMIKHLIFVSLRRLEMRSNCDRCIVVP